MDYYGSASPILELPDWVLLIIFDHVPQDSDLIAVKCTCRRFRFLFYDAGFWKRRALVIRSRFVNSIVKNILHYSSYSLRRVDLTNCPSIQDNDLLCILMKCRHIRSVALSFCVSERALMYIAVYTTRLVELNVSGCCSASTTFVQAVLERHASSLTTLVLSDCMGLRKGNDFDEMVDMLGRSTNMQVLDISWTKKSYTACPFHERHLITIIKGCKSLRSLHLSGSLITSAVIASLSKHCQHITSLSLGRTCIEDVDIIRLTNYCRLLEYLDLTSCTMLTRKGFASLAALSCLNHLILNHCVQLRGESVRFILNRLPALQHLELACCINLVDADFMEQTCFNLKSICISQTHLSQNFVNVFMNRKTSVVITCRNCYNIERDVYVYVSEL